MGEEIDSIDVRNGRYGHRNPVVNWFSISIAGRQMIVFTEKEGWRRFSRRKEGKPFLYDVDKLKKFRNR